MSRSDINKDVFIELLSQSKSVVDLARKLGYPRYYSNSKVSGTAYREIKSKCKEYGVEYPAYSRYKNRYDSMLPAVVSRSKSIAEVVRKLGCPTNSGSIATKIGNRIIFLGLDTSHFTGASWSKGKTKFNDDRLKKQSQQVESPWKQAFSKGSKIKNDSLMSRLVLTGKRKYKCAICGLKEWNNQPIRLRLDHINGDRSNNEENNLRLLCPNCDSQTETFCRGTRQKSKKKMWWEELSSGSIPIGRERWPRPSELRVRLPPSAL